MTQGTPDPFTVWRDWLTQSERQWNEFYNQVMSTDQYGQAMGQMMDVYLTMQKNMQEAMGRWFTALNLPTRTDVLTLGNRLGDVEARLVAIERALEGLAKAGEKGDSPKPAARPRPARTRKPPAA
jgi:polyhydroxyalkanoic acid synthase PhaR subunit